MRDHTCRESVRLPQPRATCRSHPRGFPSLHPPPAPLSTNNTRAVFSVTVEHKDRFPECSNGLLTALDSDAALHAAWARRAGMIFICPRSARVAPGLVAPYLARLAVQCSRQARRPAALAQRGQRSLERIDSVVVFAWARGSGTQCVPPDGNFCGSPRHSACWRTRACFIVPSTGGPPPTRLHMAGGAAAGSRKSSSHISCSCSNNASSSSRCRTTTTSNAGQQHWRHRHHR